MSLKKRTGHDKIKNLLTKNPYPYIEERLTFVMEKVFQVAIKDIPEGRKQIEIAWNETLVTRLLGDVPEVVSVALPLKLNGFFDRRGPEIVLQATCRVQLTLNCTRCLNDFPYRLDAGFRYVFNPGPEKERPEEAVLQPEELETVYYEGENIDLGAVIREQIYLNLPQYPHCRENCLGLCPTCGADLNTGGCECSRADGRESSPFSVLKKLKDKKKL